jgi:phosphatidylcholine synthase
MQYSLSNKIAAWSVHIFTVSGIFLGFLALLSSINNDFTQAVFFLALALFVDGVDGTLARHVDVENVIPSVDGSVLDNIIDYFNYVLVPTFMIHWFGFLGENYSLFLCFLILSVSSYTFANKGIKTDDYYFSGFPALWNLVVLYFYLLDTPELMNIAVVLLLSVFTFIPIKYVHPIRVIELRKTNIAMTSLWCVTTVYLLLTKESLDNSYQLITVDFSIYTVWILVNLYFLFITLRRSFKL